MTRTKETSKHAPASPCEKRRRIRLRGVGVFLLALGCARSWLTLLFASPSLPLDAQIDPHHAFDILFCAVSLIVALNAARIAPILAARWPKPLALASMTGGSLAAIAASFLPHVAEPLAIASGILGGIGFAMFLLIWAETLSMLSIARIALYSALSQLFAVVLVYFCEGLDTARLLVAIAVLPAVAIVALESARRTLEEEQSVPKAQSARTSRTVPWKLIVLFAVFNLAYGLREQQLAAGAGMHSSISTGMAMAALAATVYFFSDRISLNAVSKSALPLMLCGFLLVPFEGFLGSVVSSYMISIGYSLTSLLVSLMLYDISKRFGLFAICLLGLKNATQIFVVAGSDIARVLDSFALPAGTADTLLTALVVALLFFAAFILFSEKELTSTWGVRFMESEALTEEGLRSKQLEKRCDELSRTFKLSPREDEILRLYAAGLNGPQIEKELFIAEGTLKTHTRHIYEKFGISSRKELYAALGVKK